MTAHFCPWLVGQLLAHLEPKARTYGMGWTELTTKVRVRHNGVWAEHEAVVRGTYGRVKSMTVDVG